MTISAENSAVQAAHFDPYDVELNTDPYPMFRRLREEQPLYYNEQHDFYALSRFSDVNKALVDHETFSSARGAIVELIKANIEIPPGTVIFEDPPIHDIHRKLLARMFTPRKINALEPMIREYCAQSLDPLIGADRFDFVTDLGAQMPMKVISALLGIPEDDQEMIRDHANAQMRTEAGKPMKADGFVTGELFEAYIDWRIDHPSDDIMTELLNAEFVDETGTTRHLTREELLTYLNVVAGAGNETTTRLIGWAGKVLAEHPDQRRELVENPSLIPQAVEELLRFEPPAPHVARYVTRNVEYLRPDRARGQRDDDADRRRRPRPSPVPTGRRRFRHPPRGTPAPRIQRRHALLPRIGVGSARGAHRSGGDPQAVPRMGCRHGQCVTLSDVDRPRLGFHAGHTSVKSVPLTTN